MKEERQAAVEAVLRAGHIPAGMELFAAGSDSQLATIRKWIDESDAFLLILGGRYGTVERESGKSYIALEYEHANTTGKPYFAVVITEAFLDAKVKASDLSVVERENGHLLKEFRELVTSKICRFFGNHAELKLAILESLQAIGAETPNAGWVRAREAIDPKATLETLTKLQKENDLLRSEVSRLQEIANEDKKTQLSNEAADILIKAATLGGGTILYREAMGSLVTIRTGSFEFISNSSTHRDQEIYVSALKELSNYGLIRSNTQSIYHVSRKGYEVSDQILQRRKLNQSQA
jgi:hypothetical protein